ncbi:MAG TPA: hypothetical protein VFS21_26030 [Roseiflexaceae bacterium]|nr:hypothetical protein [Roseiflexaceae bacterium]
MSQEKALQLWEVWYPKAAATGLLVGRGRIDPTEQLLLHAAPPQITVAVTDGAGRRLGFGQDLEQTDSTPICRLRLRDGRITREDIWPTEAEQGLPVLLPGGEVGILLGWWHADDRRSWRWQVEFFNRVE